MPIYLASCSRLVVVLGPSYLSRIWCCVECFTFLRMGGDEQRILVLPIIDADQILMPATLCRTAAKWLRDFDVSRLVAAARTLE